MAPHPLGDEVPFDKRPCWLWINGEFVQNEDALVSVLLNSAQYGIAGLEGERAYGPESTVFRLEDHGARFHYTLNTLGFTIQWTAKDLDQAVLDLIEKNGFRGKKDLYIRRFIYWDGTDLRVGAGRCKPIVAIYICEVVSPLLKPETLENGLSLMWAPYARAPGDAHPADTKASLQFGISTMVTSTAHEKGWGDALYLNGEGYLADSSVSNIFLVRLNPETGEPELHTPLADCFLPGITRESVIALALSWGMKVVIGRIQPEMLAEPETKEVFLCGTAIELVPVGKIQALPGTDKDLIFPVGEVTRKVIDGYRNLVHKSPEEVNVLLKNASDGLRSVYQEEHEIIERYKSKRVDCRRLWRG